jgi:hypothetical protein
MPAGAANRWREAALKQPLSVRSRDARRSTHDRPGAPRDRAALLRLLAGTLSPEYHIGAQKR